MADYKIPIITGTSLSVGDLLRWDGCGWVNYPDSNYHTDARAATWLAANHETTYTHGDIALNTTHRGSDGSDHTHIDQAVTIAASPTFAALTISGTVAVAGASITIGRASTTTGTLVLHDSNSANTITITVPDISAGSLTFTLPATDGDANQFLQTNGSGALTWAAGGSNHAMLDGTVHTDSVADDVSRGSIIYGNATPKWDELVKGAANTFLGSDGTDVSYRTATQVRASLSLAETDSPTFAGLTIGNLTLADGSITDSGGEIDFGDENLLTAGNIVSTSGHVRANADADSADYHALSLTTAETTKTKVQLKLLHTTTGNMADGFGVALQGRVMDDAAIDNLIGQFQFQRGGADNTGDFTLTTMNGGAANKMIVIDTSVSSISFGVTGSPALYAINTYSDTVGDTNRDLFIDDAGLIGYVSSSLKYKKNIKDLTGSDIIYQLTPRSFDRIKDNIPDIGLIAEEVDELGVNQFIPNLISYRVNEIETIVPDDELGWKSEILREQTNEPEMINYKNLIVPMLAELQKLKQEVDELKTSLQQV